MTQIRVYNPAEETPEDYQALHKLACKLYILMEENQVRIKELEAEKEKLTRLWSTALERNDSLSAQNQRLQTAAADVVAENVRLAAENERQSQMLLARINDMETETAKMVGWNNRLVDENERLSKALVECQEAFDNGRNVGERSVGYGELEY